MLKAKVMSEPYVEPNRAVCRTQRMSNLLLLSSLGETAFDLLQALLACLLLHHFAFGPIGTDVREFLAISRHNRYHWHVADGDSRHGGLGG
jgi:hypothetical protein